MVHTVSPSGGVDCPPATGPRQTSPIERGTPPPEGATKSGLAGRLGEFTRERVGCGVCLWIDQLSESDRDTFDDWIINGGNISQLWRECCNDPDNPLRVQRPRFAQCINEHHRGGSRALS